MTFLRRLTLILLVYVLTGFAIGDPVTSPASSNENSDPLVDFSSDRTFVDPADAVQSRQYLQRALLSNIIRETSKLHPNQFYVNHLIGFSNVWQRAGVSTKYTSGLQGLSLGYVTGGGHGFEVGVELAALSNLYGGYRYFWRPQSHFLWGFIGAGVGAEVNPFRFTEKPAEADTYDGPKNMIFTTVGLMVPIVDVTIKAEVRFNFYSMQRIVFTQGIGVIFFI